MQAAKEASKVADEGFQSPIDEMTAFRVRKTELDLLTDSGTADGTFHLYFIC